MFDSLLPVAKTHGWVVFASCFVPHLVPFIPGTLASTPHPQLGRRQSEWTSVTRNVQAEGEPRAEAQPWRRTPCLRAEGKLEPRGGRLPGEDQQSQR